MDTRYHWFIQGTSFLVTLLAQGPFADVAADEPKISNTDSATFAALQAQYQGRTIDVSFRDMVGVLPADELTHGLFPYPARLVRHIPRMLLNCQQVVAGVSHVVDPFCGSGTVLLEAQQRGIHAHGIEQNPIGALIARVKTTPMNAALFSAAAQTILEMAKRGRRFADTPHYIRRWYSPEAFSALSRLAWGIAGYDGPVGDALAVLLALTARKVANTDRRIPVPVRPKVLTTYAARDVWTTWSQEAAKLSGRIDKLLPLRSTTTVTLGDSRDSDSWPAEVPSSKMLVFTSPPYGAAQKYIRSTSLELGWLGYASSRGTIDLERNSIGREHLTAKEAEESSSPRRSNKANEMVSAATSVSSTRGAIYSNYFADMERVFSEVGRRAGKVVLISGTNTVGGIEIATYGVLADMLENRGFVRTLSLRDEIRGRSLLTKRRSTASPSHAEYVEIFERGF